MKLLELNSYTPKLKWAVGQHAGKAHGFAKVHHQRDTHVVWVNVKDAFRYGNPEKTLDLETPEGGPNSIGNRVERAKQHWADGGYMNPSEVYLDRNGRIDWTDGRHRMLAAYQLGEKYAPVFISQEDLEKLEDTKIRHHR